MSASPDPARSPRTIALGVVGAIVAIVVVLFLAGVFSGDDDSGTSTAQGGTTPEVASLGEPLRVGVSPVPHAEILGYVKDNLLDGTGLELDIREFSDYVLPNTALNDGELDANYFQTPAYLKDQAAARKIPLVSIVGVHIEPLGLYSKDVKDLASVPQGAEVAIPNDATNEARALRLLAANDLITLKDESAETITPRDITENEKNLEFTEVEAAQTPRSLDDADLAVINGNYALEADLTPSEDALALETAEGNPNANLLATVESKQGDPRIAKLAELLTSPQVKTFIEGKYNGSVIPAF